MDRRSLCATFVAALTAVVVECAAARAADCPPLGHLPTYESGEVTRRDYDQIEFSVTAGDETQTVNVAGQTCVVPYFPRQGTEPLSDLEIQKNYRDQLQKLGAQILFTDGRTTTAKLTKDAKETWIKVYSQETEIDVNVVEKQPVKQVLTAPAGNDYRLLGHMPQYAGATPEKKNFDQLDFTVQDGDGSKDVTVEGAKYYVSYAPKEGATPSSDLEIQENYRTALKNLGAQILFEDGRTTVARLDSNGQPIWISVHSQETEIDVSVIEEKPFQASIEPPKADALKAALDKDGRVALYVNFDFAKATLRPDAAPVIAQVVKLLQDNAALKLAVEGHTDNVGGHDVNVKLSQERAAAVVDALVKAGIARDRLSSAGYGPDHPIADNGTTEGRAKNRRVELVKA